MIPVDPATTYHCMSHHLSIVNGLPHVRMYLTPWLSFLVVGKTSEYESILRMQWEVL